MRFVIVFVLSPCVLLMASAQAPQGPNRVDRLIELTHDLRYRVPALHELAAIGPEVIPAVVADGRRSKEFDLSALWIMGSKALPALLDLLDDPDFGLSALGKLTQLKDPRSVSHLKRFFESTSNRDLRSSIVHCLANIEDKAALQFVDNLLSSADQQIVVMAADAVATSPISSFSRLTTAFRAFPTLSARHTLSRTEQGRRFLLGCVRKGGPGAAPALDALALAPPDDVPLFKEFLLGQDEQMREAAGKALGRLGTPAACQTLLEAYEDLPKGHYLSTPIFAASKIAESRGTKGLLEPWLRARVKGPNEALNILAQWYPEDRTLLPLIRDRLHGPDAHLRDRAIKALSTMTVSDKIPILMEAAESAKRDYGVFIEAMGKSKDPACLPYLKRLYEEKPERRTWVLIAVRYLPTHDVEDFLLTKLNDPNEHMRNLAIKACGWAKVVASVPMLCKMLDSGTETSSNEDAIAGALSSIATPVAVTSLRRYVERVIDETERDVSAAIRAITKAGGESAFAALKALYPAAHPARQSAILYGLGALDVKGTLPFLESVMNDPVQFVSLKSLARDMIARKKLRSAGRSERPLKQES